MANVLHSSLSSSESHEVKGADGATLGYVLTSDGSNSAAFQDPQLLIDTVEEAPNDGHLYSRASLGWALTPTVPNVLYYEYDDVVGPAPDQKAFRYNNADQTLATEIYFDDKDLTNRTAIAILDYQKIGDILYLSRAEDPSQGQGWVIDSITNNGGYVTYAVTPNQPILFSFAPGGTIVWNTVQGAVNSLTDLDPVGNSEKCLVINSIEDGFDLETRSVYGNENFYAEELFPTTESAQVWTTHLSMIEGFEAGKQYDISWSAVTGTGQDNKLASYRVRIDGVNLHEIGDYSGSTSLSVSGQRRVTMTGGPQTITLEYKASQGGGTTVFMYDGTITAVSVDV